MSVELAEAYVSLIPSARGMGAGIAAELDGPAAAAGKSAGTTAASSYTKALAAGLALAGAAVAVAIGKGFSDALGAEAGVDVLQASLGITPQRAAELGDVASRAYRNAWGDSLGEVQNIVGALESSFEGLGADALDRLTPKAVALGDAFGIDVTQGVQTASEMVSSGLADSAEGAFDLLTVGLQKMPAAIRDELLAASNEYGGFFADLGISGSEAFGLLTTAAEDGVYGIDKMGDAIKELTIRGTDMSKTSVDAYTAAGLSAEDMAARFLAGGDTARGALDDLVVGLQNIEDPVERSNAAIALFGTPLEDLSVTEIPAFLDSLAGMGDGLGNVDEAAHVLADTVSGNAKTSIEAFKRQALGQLADFATNTLIPAFESVVGFFQRNWPTVQDGLETFGRWFSDNKDLIIGAVVGIGVGVATVLVPAFIGWATAAASAAAATLIAIAPFVLIGAALAAIGAGLVYAYQNVGWFRDAVDTVAAFFTGTVIPAFQAFIAVVFDVVGRVVEFIRTNWDTIATIITTVFDAIWAYIEVVWNTIRGVIESYITVIRGIIQAVTSLIRGDWSGVWEGIKKIVTGVWDGIKALITGAIDSVRAYLAGVMSIISGAWSAVWQGIADRVSRIWSSIATYVSNGISDVVSFVRGLPGRVASAIGDGFSSIWEKFRDVINRIIRTWNNLSFQFPSFDGDWNGPLPGGNFTVGGWTINTPNLPEFHDGIDRVPGAPGEEMLAILEAGERVIPASQNNALGAGAGGAPITLIIEGRPFSAMIAEHEQAQVAELMAGRR